MPPKPAALPSQVVSAAVKAAAAASKTSGAGGVGGINNPVTTLKQPPKKKKTVFKAKKPGSHSTVVISKNDTVHPPKMGVMKSKPATTPSSSSATASGGAVDSVQFSSQFTSSAAANAGSKLPVPPIVTSAQQIQQLKIERAQIAKRELAEMDAIERAFREDASVWSGPSNVLFPKRYHAAPDDEGSGGDAKDKRGGEDKKEEVGDGNDKKSSINNPYLAFYGSQSQGWMYGEGLAGIGGRSWMEATSKSDMNDAVDKNKEKTQTPDEATSESKTNESSAAESSFLMDDVTIIDNALKANGLTRNDVTPKAYACFLEQARRFALEMLANAQDYAIHAQRNTIPSLLPADLLLAAEMSEDGTGGGGIHGVPSTLPTPEEISDLASEVNRAPLPPIPTHCYNGVALPPLEHQLTARTYDVVNGARVAQRMMRGGDLPSTDLGGSAGSVKNKAAGGGSGTKSGPSSKKKTVGSYGAGKGRQISVHMKSKTSAASGASESAAPGLGGGKSTSTSTTTKLGSKKQKRTLTEL